MTGLREINDTSVEVTEGVVTEARCGFALAAFEKLVEGRAKSVVCYACGGSFYIIADGSIMFNGQCISTPIQQEE